LEGNPVDRRSQLRWAVGTLAVVAIALSIDSVRRTFDDSDPRHAPQIAIRRQLDAFNRGDYRAAYQFAAPEIQAQFPLPAFQQMVQRGYPQIAHSRTVSFGPSEVEEGRVVVPVTVTGQDGVVAHFLYVMEHQTSGWRIAGVEGDHTFHGLPGLPKRPPE
jgi:hypothetical protein